MFVLNSIEKVRQNILLVCFYLSITMSYLCFLQILLPSTRIIVKLTIYKLVNTFSFIVRPSIRNIATRIIYFLINTYFFNFKKMKKDEILFFYNKKNKLTIDLLKFINIEK